MFDFGLAGLAFGAAASAFFCGKLYGCKLMRERAEAAAQNFIDALREQYGEVVVRALDVDGELEDYEFTELPEELEELGGELFNL